MKIGRAHWRVVITAGMGFFTDAYDLFVIGIVTTILSPIWHLSAVQLGLLNGATVAAAVFGAVFFGYLSDKYGRKKTYGIEVVILFVGAILSALSPSFVWLVVSRILVGFGIGGDYPTSAVVVSEYANRKNRGFLVLMVFAMQALGLIVGPLIASLLLSSGLAQETIWRLLLGLGAIPAASVFYLRRKTKETPRFLQHKGKISRRLLEKKWMKYLLGTAGAWFFLDVALYGNGISMMMIINSLNPKGSLIAHTLISAAIFLVFAVPGYLLSAKYVDRIGRKPLQFLGFAMMALTFGIIALTPSLTQHFVLFFVLFGGSFFFINFGPNATTFLIPAEIYPTDIRARAHGISAAVGKIGAFIGAFLMPTVLGHFGLHWVFGVMATMALAGMLMTGLVPEMRGVSLDEVEPAGDTGLALLSH